MERLLADSLWQLPSLHIMGFRELLYTVLNEVLDDDLTPTCVVTIAGAPPSSHDPSPVFPSISSSGCNDPRKGSQLPYEIL